MSALARYVAILFAIDVAVFAVRFARVIIKGCRGCEEEQH